MSMTPVVTPMTRIWSRSLKAHNAIARQNAVAAARVLAERRAEREGVERYLADRALAEAE